MPPNELTRQRSVDAPAGRTPSSEPAVAAAATVVVVVVVVPALVVVAGILRYWSSGSEPPLESDPTSRQHFVWQYIMRLLGQGGRHGSPSDLLDLVPCSK